MTVKKSQNPGALKYKLSMQYVRNIFSKKVYPKIINIQYQNKNPYSRINKSDTNSSVITIIKLRPKPKLAPKPKPKYKRSGLNLGQTA